jgi:hypothetical protein
MTFSFGNRTTLAGAILFSSLLAGCFVTTRGGVAIVGIHPGVVVYRQPPPPRHTVMVRPPAPHPQATWVEGHWQWNGSQHVWVEGFWVEPRPNHRYVAPRWEQQGNGWVYYEGYYETLR